MKKITSSLRACLAVCFTTMLFFPASAQVAVENVRGVQRAGTKLVDVYFDVTGTEAKVAVSLEVSSNGGASYAVAATSLTGQIGPGIAPGRNRKLTWDAGADWNEQFSAQIRYRVRATEEGAGNGDFTGFALIPAGSFQMGDAFNEGNFDERPVHSVFVSAFYMAKHETTKELWDEVRAWGLNNGYTDLVTGNGTYASKGVNHPVHSVSWYDTVKWCNARSQRDGLTPCYTVGGVVFKTGEDSGVSCNFAASGYRLPTEAEWEKAARGGLSGKRFPWGDAINQDRISHSLANYYNSFATYEYPGRKGYHPTYRVGAFPWTSPVGSFAANGYGLFDMAGNVWEWTGDWHWGSYYGQSGNTSDPVGPGYGTTRVIRGGSWSSNASNCRVASRYDVAFPIDRTNGTGFRAARSAN